MFRRDSAILLTMALMVTVATGQTVTGSGTSETVPVFTGSSTVGNSPITISGSNVGIGTTSPGAKLDVSDNAAIHSGIQKQASFSIGTASSPFYEVLAAQSLPQAGSNPSMGATGFGFVSGANQASPIIWMYGYGGQNSFRIISKGYATNITSDPVLFDVDTTGNVGIGTTSPAYTLDVAGKIRTSSGGMIYPDGTTQTTAWTGAVCGGDYAESVDVSGDRTKYEPGDVLVIDPDTPGKFLKSAEPYSTSVTGIYSTKPGVVGRRQTTPKSPDEVPMAMIGIVPTKVSAENGPIRPGDLLVTSSTLGYAMKGTDRNRMLGAVIGKALGSLDSGSGVIEVVVALQ